MTIRTASKPLGGGLIIDTSPVRFEYTGELQEYKVQAGVKKLKVECVGSRGFNGGNGGKVDCVLDVSSIRKLYVWVGGYAAAVDEQIYNASDIRTSAEGITDDTSLHNRLVVAGAGGACGGGYAAGAGGGLVGGQGRWDIITTGYPGTQTAGGAHSRNNRGSIKGTPNWGQNGTFGLGGAGPYVGGSGWYGGGSGGYAYASKAGTQRSGGGGGSSYTHPELCSGVVHTQGFNADGAGYIILTPMED